MEMEMEMVDETSSREGRGGEGGRLSYIHGAYISFPPHVLQTIHEGSNSGLLRVYRSTHSCPRTFKLSLFERGDVGDKHRSTCGRPYHDLAPVRKLQCWWRSGSRSR